MFKLLSDIWICSELNSLYIELNFMPLTRNPWLGMEVLHLSQKSIETNRNISIYNKIKKDSR